MKLIPVILGCILATILFSVIKACGAEVTLVWDANTDAVTKGYFLHGYTNGVRVASKNTGTNTVSTMPAYSGVTNSYNVTAYDAAGLEGDASASVEYIVKADAPQFIVNSVSASPGRWRWRLQWNPAAPRYEVELRRGDEPQSTINTTNAAVTFDLAEHGTFTARVRGTDTEWSAEANLILTAPMAVTTLRRQP